MLPEPATLAWQSSIEWLEETSLSLLRHALIEKQMGKLAVVSSFGVESAVLLHLVSRLAPETPVIFIDTRMMFQETLDYQKDVAKKLGLTDIRSISAGDPDLGRADPFGRLHLSDADSCCELRKVVPLEKALEGFDGWINGRKRHQSSNRAAIRPVEADASGRLKINPLLHWERADIEVYFEIHDLPRHPLVKYGFTSIGCAPCTARTATGEDPRAGRWRDQEKTECGIHISADGKIERRVA